MQVDHAGIRIQWDPRCKEWVITAGLYDGDFKLPREVVVTRVDSSAEMDRDALARCVRGIASVLESLLF